MTDPAKHDRGMPSHGPAVAAGDQRDEGTQTPVDAEARAQALRETARRKRRLDEVFGDVLPETTLDEREPGHHGGFSAEHYRRSRPPHWGVKS